MKVKKQKISAVKFENSYIKSNLYKVTETEMNKNIISFKDRICKLTDDRKFKDIKKLAKKMQFIMKYYDDAIADKKDFWINQNFDVCAVFNRETYKYTVYELLFKEYR